MLNKVSSKSVISEPLQDNTGWLCKIEILLNKSCKMLNTDSVLKPTSLYICLPYCLVRTGIGGVVAPSPLCDLAASHT